MARLSPPAARGSRRPAADPFCGPAREAAELAEGAGQAAAAGFLRVMPRRGVRAGEDRSYWPFGMTLMTMSEQLRASRAAEAAARRSADEMSEHLGEAGLELL